MQIRKRIKIWLEKLAQYPTNLYGIEVDEKHRKEIEHLVKIQSKLAKYDGWFMK